MPNKFTVLSALLSAVLSTNSGISQAQDTARDSPPTEPSVPAETAPESGVGNILPAPSSPPAPRIPLQPGEILLEGRIEGVSFASQELTMSVSSFTLPNGRSEVLRLPRLKIVRFSKETPVTVPSFHTMSNGADAGNFQILDPQGINPQIINPQIIAPPVVDPQTGEAIVAPAVPIPSVPRSLTSWQLWPGHAVAAVGKDGGSGRLLNARLLEMGEMIAPLFQPQELPPGSRYFNGVQEWVAASGLRAKAKFGGAGGLSEIGGRAERGNPNSDHPRGLALDFMVGRNAKLGDNIATYFQQYAGLENVAYIIWKNTILHAGARTDWSLIPVDYTGDVTLRHMDHVHVSYRALPGLPGPWLTEELIRGNLLSARHAPRRPRVAKKVIKRRQRRR